MSRLNPFRSPILARAARPSPALDPALRSKLAATSQRSISSRVYSQTAPHLGAPRGNVRASLARARTPFAQGGGGGGPRRTFRTSARRRAKEAPGAEEGRPLTLGERMKKLSREYGWVTVGVYLGLSVLDFPFCFLLVKTAGVERIAELERTIVTSVDQYIPEPVQDAYCTARDAVKGTVMGWFSKSDGEAAEDLAAEVAPDASRSTAGLVTQLALAYAIHKSLIVFRVPLTAAVTPKVVKVLRSWGWQIGKKKTKP